MYTVLLAALSPRSKKKANLNIDILFFPALWPLSLHAFDFDFNFDFDLPYRALLMLIPHRAFHYNS
jgi:hypothetical protein